MYLIRDHTYVVSKVKGHDLLDWGLLFRLYSFCKDALSVGGPSWRSLAGLARCIENTKYNGIGS